MPRVPYIYVQMPTGWSWLVMPIIVYVHIHLGIGYFKARDVKNNNQENNPTEGTHNPSGSTQGSSTPRDKPSIGNIVISYTQGLGEIFKKICMRYGIHTHFMGSSILRQLLVRPKDQDPKEKKSVVIYSYQCGETASDEEYIGETSRTLGERYREHL